VGSGQFVLIVLAWPGKKATGRRLDTVYARQTVIEIELDYKWRLLQYNIDYYWFAGEFQAMRKRRIRFYVVVPLLVLITLSIGIAPAAAWYETEVDTVSAWVGSYNVGKHGSMLQYGYSQGGSHSDTHPQFYASMVSGADWGDATPYYFIPRNMWIKVWGYDPLGNRLTGDRFTSLSVMVSPDDSGTELQVLGVIWAIIGDIAPEGMMAIPHLLDAAADVSGAATEYHTYDARARYYNPLGSLDESDSQRGMRFGFQLAVDPTLEGTYDIYLEFKTYFWQCFNPYVPISAYKTTTEHVSYTYDAPGGGGGGCPILSVYDGDQYVDGGLLNIHASDDVTVGARLNTIPAVCENMYRLMLTEHPLTISHIDCVQLFVRLEGGKIVSLPLVSARHSADGNVKRELKASDDIRVDTLGATHNGGISEYIDLHFLAPHGFQVTEFIFVIEGYNVITKY